MEIMPGDVVRVRGSVWRVMGMFVDHKGRVGTQVWQVDKNGDVRGMIVRKLSIVRVERPQ